MIYSYFLFFPTLPISWSDSCHLTPKPLGSTELCGEKVAKSSSLVAPTPEAPRPHYFVTPVAAHAFPHVLLFLFSTLKIVTQHA